MTVVGFGLGLQFSLGLEFVLRIEFVLVVRFSVYLLQRKDFPIIKKKIKSW